MPMRATTVRFAEDLWQQLERQAAAEGISAAQLVRDSALMRVAEKSPLSGRPGNGSATQAAPDLSAWMSACSDPERLEALRATGLLDSGPDPALDRLADTARRVMNAPVALITLVEADRQVLKACPGLKQPWASRGEMPNSHSYCRHAIGTGEVLRIEDARLDPRVSDSPALREIDAVGYLGAPLVTSEGHVLGTLCVIDHRPRMWTTDQVETMGTLAAAVVDHIEVVRSGR